MKKALAVTLLVVTCVGAYAAGPDAALTQQDVARHNQLLIVASQAGTVRVIVQLRNAPLDAKVLGTAAGQASHGNALRVIQDRVIGRLLANRSAIPGAARATNSDVSRFGIFPGLVLNASAADLQLLLSDPDVHKVFEDKVDRPSLSQSGPLLGMSDGTFDGYAGAGQVVAVLDTGVEKTHTYLSGTVVSEACYSSNYPAYSATTVCPGGVTESVASGSGVNCSSAVNGCGHGTHVAGIVVSQSATQRGMANQAKVIAVQIFSRFDSTYYCNTSPCALTFNSDQIKGLERVYALRNTYKIAAVNMSIGGGSSSGYCDGDSRKPIIDLLKAEGIATVIAAGNDYDRNSLSYPACISSAVSIGATDKSDVVAPYSNSNATLDLWAPGSDINSTVPGGSFQSWDGTSMATPHVAGGFAVMKEVDPTASVDLISSTLALTGDMVTDARNGVSRPRVHFRRAANVMEARTRLTNGSPIHGNAAPANVSRYLSVAVPYGATNLVIQSNGGTGDPSMYVSFGNRPRTDFYACGSSNLGTTETCQFANPSWGTYHILLQGNAAFSGVTVTASYDFHCTGESTQTLSTSYTGRSELTTCGVIESAPTSTNVAATSTLQLNSGERIVLKSGFKVRRGGRLWARVYQ